jgi:hypothetical protein
MSTSFKTYWGDHYRKNSEFFERDIEPFKEWDRLREHGSFANTRLTLGALQALYADGPHAIIQRFLLAALEIVDRAITEIDFENGKWQQKSFPLNRGEAFQVRAYARALGGGFLSTDDLLQASTDYEQWVYLAAGRNWDAQDEAKYLNAVRMALIAGDRDRFASLLQAKRSFKSHTEEYAIYKAMATEFEHSGTIENRELKIRFKSLFDRYRDPQFKSDFYVHLALLRFELGIIWCKCFFPTSEFGWQEVINAISE